MPKLGQINRVVWKLLPKVGQLNRFLEEKGEQSRNIQARFKKKYTNISSDRPGKKAVSLIKVFFKIQQLCTIVAINRSTWIALKMGQKMRI